MPHMRITLLVLCCSISITVSAQWWRIKKPVVRPPSLALAEFHPSINFMNTVIVAVTPLCIHNHTLSRSDYDLEISEDAMMKTAQHNMRFRIYSLASYNFSDLAQLYALQNRFSEAKWYFLQSSFLSRQQNNNKLTISNLKKLAAVKAEIGDFVLARQDLLEARDMASSCGWLVEVIDVEKKLNELQHNKYASLRNDRRYAEELADQN